MTKLREQMIQDMVLRGLTLNTQRSYLKAITEFARHYGRSRSLLSEDEVKSYLFFDQRQLLLPPVLPQLPMLPGASSQNRTGSCGFSRGPTMVGENQSPSGVRTPCFHSTLKCPDLSIGELSWILVMKEFHEFYGISTGFDIKPRSDSWPDPIEWIGARPPVACGFWLRTMGRPDLTLLPRGGETF